MAIDTPDYYIPTAMRLQAGNLSYNSGYWNAEIAFARHIPGHLSSASSENPETINYGPFDGLTITCQSDPRTAKAGDQPYAWSVGYKHGVNLGNYADKAKLLGKIDRGLTRLSDRYGYPTTFSQYVLRVADILGLTTFFALSKRPEYGTWRYMNTAEAGYWLDNAYGDFVQKHKAE